MPSLPKILWHRKALVLGIMILSGLFGNTLGSLIKNPYVAQSVLVVDAPSSGLYRDMAVIAKKKVASTVFYNLSEEEQTRFKVFFHMDTSITGKLYDRYSGRAVDYAHPYDPATILALHFDLVPFERDSSSIKLIFSAPQPEFALSYSALIFKAYEAQIKDRYVFIYQNKEKDILSPTDHRQHVYVRMAVSEVNTKNQAQWFFIVIFFFFFLITGGCLAVLTEKYFRTEN
ncbi:MAG: hypothetical protein KDJ26_03915 [Alphaproteobacteria bacterium]|nr:hypothetical protein [Alphaproteobacteria bacterium]